MATRMPAELVVNALEMAVKRRGGAAEVIHHSDQGRQYTSDLFQKRCKILGVKISMGSVGDCYDNAMAESFFATLECELLNIVPLFSDPQHPYTQGLIRALPDISVSRGSLHSIPGRVPPPQVPPPGCLFAPRCEHALDLCWEASPELSRDGAKSLRCFNAQPFEMG